MSTSLSELSDPRLTDDYNDFRFRSFEREAGTLANGWIYVSPSRFQLAKTRMKATKFRLGGWCQQRPHNLNLGLFACKPFPASSIITYYGGDYLCRQSCNQHPQIQKQLNASRYLCEVNKRRIVIGDKAVEYLDRTTIVFQGEEKKTQVREFYTYDNLPSNLKCQYHDAETYNKYRHQLMNMGLGFMINSQKEYIPNFKKLVAHLGRRGVKKQEAMDELTRLGLNCLMETHIEQGLMDLNDGQSAEFVVFTALRDIFPGEEVITYYNPASEVSHNRFFEDCDINSDTC